MNDNNKSFKTALEKEKWNNVYYFYTIFQLTKKPEDKIKFNLCRNIYYRKIRQAKKVWDT